MEEESQCPRQRGEGQPKEEEEDEDLPDAELQKLKEVDKPANSVPPSAARAGAEDLGIASR